jgi:glycosyltransferase involved in cell wall biosynthesis
VEQKAHLIIVAAARLLRLEGYNFQVVLAGDGQMRRQIEKAIEIAGLKEQFIITGWLSGSSVRSEIIASRALLLPSFAENLPVVIMEAMALGRPTIATYVAGIPELVQNEVTGWLVPAGDEVALADAMRNALLATTERLTDMGTVGRIRVLARHDIKQEAAKLKTLFQKGRTTNASKSSDTEAAAC